MRIVVISLLQREKPYQMTTERGSGAKNLNLNLKLNIARARVIRATV